MRLRAQLAALLLALCFFLPEAHAAKLSPLPMNQFVAGPVPKNVNYKKSNVFYKDDSITVRIMSGKFMDVKYTAARVKIAHPSQFRTVSAQQVRNVRAAFHAVGISAADGSTSGSSSALAASVRTRYCEITA